MGAILKSWSLAFRQAGDRDFIWVMGVGVAGALVVFIGLWVLAYAGYASISWIDLPLVGGIFEWIAGLGLIGDMLSGGAFIGAMALATYFLFPGVTTAIVSLFLERIVDAVDRRHYAHMPTARDLPLGESILNALTFLGIVLAINLIALPFYALFFFLLASGILLYYFINGYLLGREYFEMVALRRMTRQEATMMRRKHRGTVFGFGVVTAFLMTLPIVNLLAPALAAAAMAHLFMALRGERPQVVAEQGGGSLAKA